MKRILNVILIMCVAVAFVLSDPITAEAKGTSKCSVT